MPVPEFEPHELLAQAEAPGALSAPQLHVAPDPSGGWLVEAPGMPLPPETYSTFQEAHAQAERYCATYGWRLTTHPHPAAEEGDPDGERA